MLSSGQQVWTLEPSWPSPCSFGLLAPSQAHQSISFHESSCTIHFPSSVIKSEFQTKDSLSNLKPHHCLRMLESHKERPTISPPKSNSEVSFKGLLNSNTFPFRPPHKGKIKGIAPLTGLCTAAFAIFEIYISVCLFQ